MIHKFSTALTMSTHLNIVNNMAMTAIWLQYFEKNLKILKKGIYTLLGSLDILIWYSEDSLKLLLASVVQVSGVAPGPFVARLLVY